jgi:galactokinase
MIECQLRDEIDPDMTVSSLAELWYGDLCLTHNEAEELFERVFPSDATSIEDVAKRLRVKPEAIRERIFNGSDTRADSLPLRRRARHQRTEFWRVEQGRDALLANDAEYFGELMTQSHDSCAGDYEVSCAELDTLVEMASDAGALGARMTGAGFGGSAVCLVPTTDAKRFVETMRDKYYREYRELDPPTDAVFVVETSAPADYC